MEITISVPAMISFVILQTSMVFGLGYAFGRADIPLETIPIVYPTNLPSSPAPSYSPMPEKPLPATPLK